LPDQLNPDPLNAPQTDATPVAGSDQLSPAPDEKSARWGRADRNNLLIFVGIGFILPGPFILALHFLSKSTSSVFTVQDELPVKAITAICVALATWIVARREKRPLADYGIPPRDIFGRRFWEGTVWGFALLSAIPLILRASGNFQIDSVALTGSAALRYGLGWALVFFCVGVSEEFAFRGYWLFSFSRRFRFWPAALITSAVFGIAHLGNPGENVLGILQVVAVGLLFCLMIQRTGTLWFALGYHAAWDWAETFFYGTPDSGLIGVGRYLNTSVHGPSWLTGGSAGPEGSIIVFFVLFLCAVLIHFRFPKTIYPDRPV
jgi:membrane protease YdiL (CAAX protease family)